MSMPRRCLRSSARLLAAAALVAAGFLVAVGPALGQTPAGLADATLTLNNTSGADYTRFTFAARATAPVDRLQFTFPEDFDVSKSTMDVVALEGLQRGDVSVEESSHEGAIVKFVFAPPVPPGSNIRIQIHDVLLPSVGGRHVVKVDYVSGGTEGSIEPLPFTFETATTAESLSRWLERQPWVQAWNRVKFFKLFVQPEKIALAVPLLFVGWLRSISLVLVAFPMAIVGGLGLAFARMSKIAPMRWVAGLYINVVRGTPLFLQIYLVYVGLPLIGIRAPLFLAGVLVLALNSSAYLAEIFRAGIQSIHKGQFEAASSLGMSYWQAMRDVIIPQTVKRVLPTMTSEFILLFKDTALLSAVGVFELMLYANTIATRSGNLTSFVVAGVYYLIVTVPLIHWVGSLEARLAVSEGGQQPTPPTKRGGLFGRLGGRGELTQPALAPGTAVGATPEDHQSR